jgi:hypothetical protein
MRLPLNASQISYRSSFSMKYVVWTVVMLVITAFCTGQLSAQTPTVTLDDQSILQASTKRVGLNIGSINYWDNGQLLKNLIGPINPGFEPLIDQQIWALSTAGTTTGFTDPDKWDGEPANYWAGGTFTIVASQSAGAELNCTGLIASNTGPNSPTNTQTNPTFTMAKACAAPFSAGDIVILSKSFTTTPETWWESSKGGMWAAVSGGGKLTSDNTDLCATCGLQSLDMDATAAGSNATIVSYFDTAPSFDLFVLMNGTYQISFWAKAAVGSPTLQIAAQRLSTGGFDCGTKTQPLTNAWAQYTVSCSASETATTTKPGNAQVSFEVTNGAAYLDNVSFQKTNTDPTNTSVFRDEVFNVLKNYYNVQSGGNSGMLRDWLGQNGETYANWTAADTAHQPTASGGSYMVGPGGSGQLQLSLEDYLNLCKALHAEPYFEVPVTISEKDAASLIEFLSGPSSSVGGTRRAALGQTEPWTEVFDQIHLSYCNECWNGSSFVGQSLAARSGTPNSEYYYDYSVRAAAIFKAMRSNQYYTQGAFDLVMNAQTGVNYTMDAAIQRAHPDSIEIENYSYETVGSFATDSALWQPDLAEVYNQVVNPTDPTKFYQSVNDYKGLNACGASGSAACGVNIYEWGSGTIAGSIDQTHLDYITVGAGTGIISALQPLLDMQYFGIQADSYFSLSEYQNNGINGEIAKVWGIAVDMGGATNNMRPQYLGLSLINQSLIGPMYSCPIANNLTYNFAGSTTNGTAVAPGVPATNAVPYLYSFCFENGSSRSMVLINTDLTASHTVKFAGTNIPSGTVIQRQYAPGSPDLLNESPSGTSSYTAKATVALTTTTLSSPTSITLPPLSATAIDFVSGSSTGTSTAATPTFSVASGTYTGAQSVSLADTTTTATVHYTTDGSAPTANSVAYSSPISVTSTQTIKAVAVAAGYTTSATGSATYTITTATAPATPSFSPAAGTYAAAQSVTISDATSGDPIYYTTNGSTPTSSSTLYQGAIKVSATETLRAIAIASGGTQSTVASGTYTISVVASTPTIAPASGTYSGAQTVTLADSTSGATLYYTTDGSTPTSASTRYTGAFSAAVPSTVKAVAAGTGLQTSTVASAVYQASATVATTPTISPASGSYSGPQTVTFADSTTGANLYYTTDGSTPTSASTRYTGAFMAAMPATVKVIATGTGMQSSGIASAVYKSSSTIATPVLSLPAGTYASAQTLTIKDSTAGATIFYSTTGATTSSTWIQYTGPVAVSSTKTYSVIAVVGKNPSALVTATYTIN